MIRLYAILFAVFFAAFCLTGCSSRSSGDDKILATVANKFITLKEYKNKLARLPSYYQGVAARNKRALLDDIIVESLLLEDAVRKNVDRDSEVREIIEEARRKIIIAKYVKLEVDDKIGVSGEEVSRFYEENKESFKRPGMWRAAHILLPDEKTAKEVSAQLAAGGDFDELAKEKSIDATASRGGDVGYFKKGQVVPEFEDACFKLKVGETSGIVRTQFGYHIIKLKDKKEEAVESLEEARSAIENELRLKKRNEVFDRKVMELKNKYRVKVEEDAQKVIETLQQGKEK